MNNIKSPCLGCKSRKVGCHNIKVCEKWEQYKNEVDKLNSKIKKNYISNLDVNKVRHQKFEKEKKR